MFSDEPAAKDVYKRQEQIMLVSVGGAGAVKHVTLGVFNSERLQYESQQFSVSV